MSTRIDTLTDDAKLDILDSEILIPILEEMAAKFEDLETRLRVVEP